MKINNNCSTCAYRDITEVKLVCNRPVASENRVATNLGDVELPCPCHSERDINKKQGIFMGDGSFHVSKSKLKELEAFIFSKKDKYEDIDIEDYVLEDNV